MKRLISIILVCSILVGCSNTIATNTDSNIKNNIITETVEFNNLSDPLLLNYIEETVYTDLIYKLNSQEYFVENVQAIYLSKEFVDESETFTLSFFDDKHKELSYLGTKSGKDEDKISNVNFHVEMVDGNPTFKEAKEVFICKKLYVGKLEKEHFLLPEIYERNYPLDDLHYVYIGEITDVYTNK